MFIPSLKLANTFTKPKGSLFVNTLQLVQGQEPGATRLHCACPTGARRDAVNGPVPPMDQPGHPSESSRTQCSRQPLSRGWGWGQGHHRLFRLTPLTSGGESNAERKWLLRLVTKQCCWTRLRQQAEKNLSCFN